MKRQLSAGAALLALFLSGCGLEGQQSTLSPAGPVAEVQAETFYVTLVVSVLIFLAVGGLFAYCLVKYRVHGDLPQELPDQGHGNPLLEIGIVFISILLVGIMVVPSIAGVFYAGELPKDKEALTIKVTGLQWWWKFEYPSLGVTTGNELAMPVGKPVKFELNAPDVIHSFWIPKLGGKMDVMPGQVNWLWLQGDKEGLYYGQCAEFCGESHAFMRFRVRVLSQSDFDAWVANQKAGAVNTAAPKEMSDNQCFTCHTVRGVPGASGMVGPDLTHLASRDTVGAGILKNDKDNIKNWVLHNSELKPGNTMFKAGYTAMKIDVTDDEAEKISSYLTTLK